MSKSVVDTDVLAEERGWNIGHAALKVVRVGNAYVADYELQADSVALNRDIREAYVDWGSDRDNIAEDVADHFGGKVVTLLEVGEYED